MISSRVVRQAALAAGALVLFLMPMLVARSAGDSEAAFPGGNGKIAFEAARDGMTQSYVMNPDGTDQTNLSNDPAGAGAPVWSPDGSKILFWSFRNGNFDIYVMNADGTDRVQLTDNVAFDYDPTWSPDGTRIAFVSNRDYSASEPHRNWEIYVMDADGTDQVRLTSNSVTDYDPAWSPDGTKLALTREVSFGDWEIFLMNPDGSDQKRITYSGANLHPSWSPEGERIAFRSTRDGDFQIYVMNADGSHQTGLTGGNSFDDYPTWSPDGTKIAFFSNRDQVCHEIYVMDADGKNQTRLTNNWAYDLYPDWQPVPSQSTPMPTNGLTPTATSPVGMTKGDVNCDDIVKAQDGLNVLRIIAGLIVHPFGACTDSGNGVPQECDVDCDGRVSAVDALKILRFVAGLGVTQTEPCPDIGTSP